MTTNYILHGKLITHMTVNFHDWDENEQREVLHFFYDAQSSPVKVNFSSRISAAGFSIAIIFLATRK